MGIRDFLFDQVEAKFRKVRPGIAVSGFTMHYGVLDVFEQRAATRLAYDWLWKDLSRISLVEGIRGGQGWE